MALKGPRVLARVLARVLDLNFKKKCGIYKKIPDVRPLIASVFLV